MNWEAIFWLAALVLFLVTEGATVSLVSIWFAAGTLGAIVVALLGGGIVLQVAVFLILSILLLLSLRPMVRTFIHPKLIRTNVDSVVGSTGIVVTPVNNIAALGQVQIGGVEWSARSSDGSHISAGTLVKVDRIEGVKVFVTPAEEPVTV